MGEGPDPAKQFFVFGILVVAALVVALALIVAT